MTSDIRQRHKTTTYDDDHDDDQDGKVWTRQCKLNVDQVADKSRICRTYHWIRAAVMGRCVYNGNINLV